MNPSDPRVTQDPKTYKSWILFAFNTEFRGNKRLSDPCQNHISTLAKMTGLSMPAVRARLKHDAQKL